jgi:GMP reductase
MAKIQEEVKLDFKDVLIRPKRSTLKSRSQVSLERTIRMKHSGKELTCVPIIAAKSVHHNTHACAHGVEREQCVRRDSVRIAPALGTQPPAVPLPLACSMDTVGTFEMALGLAKFKILTAVHKHYTVDQWKAFVAAHTGVLPFLAVSSGISEDDFKKLETILAECKGLETICLDVANG